MAGRPPKTRLDYAGWSVDIFDNDTKIDKLLDAQGWYGFSVYFYLCLRAYGSDGYFYKWSYDDCASTSRKMGCGISSGTVKEAVECCLRIGLFDKGLFERWGILTSRGIQKRYCVAIKERDVKKVIMEYWLLQDYETMEFCKGILKLPLNPDLSKINSNSPTGNNEKKAGNINFNPQKDSKENNTKLNNISVIEKEKEIVESTISLLNSLLGTTFRSDDKKNYNLIMELLRKGYTKNDLENVVKKKCEEWKDTEYQKCLTPMTLFGEKFDNYLNQVPQVKTKKKGFRNFEERTYSSEYLARFLAN